MRSEIARLLGWAENKVRIKVPYLGGGYGGKLYIKLEALVTACSMIARRPVKIALTMEEQFYQITKHPATVRIKSGVDKSGRITARKCEVFWNGGAYADIGPRVTHKSGFTAGGPYDIDNMWIDSYAMYTNMTPAGALRGFGMPQLVFAHESHTDMMARALNVDPVEFRRKNVLHNGRPQATGTILKDAPLEAILDHVAERLRWKEKFDRGSGTLKRGRGLAFALKACVSPTTSVAIINVGADGSPTLYISTVDMGQGSDTGMAQIVGEVLNVPAEVRAGSSPAIPTSRPTTWARSARARCSTWATRCGSPPRTRAARSTRLRREVGEPEGSNTPVSGLFIKKYGMKAGNIVGSGSYKPDYVAPDHETGLSPEITPFWMVACTGAEVEVDTETGRVRVQKLINAVDCGTLVNPRIVETQISGAALMQLGFTMFEKIHLDNGQITNASLADYKIPGIADVPAVMVNEAIDAYQHNAPFGAKGVGESATLPLSPAIANALDDAVGVRLTELPLTAEAVFRALREKAGRTAGGRLSLH